MLKKLGIAAVATALLATAAVTSASAQELYGTLGKIKETGVINMGHREGSVPFAYMGPEGKPIGYTVDLCYKIIDKIKEELELPDLAVNLVPVTSQTRIPLLANETIDIECGSTTNNLTRSKQIDYLAITFLTGTKIAVRKGSGIKEVEDLDGKSIALALGTTNKKAVERVMKEKGLNIKILNVKDHPEGWLSFETGRVDAYATDDVLLYGLISKSKNPEQIEVVGRFLSYDPYGIMVRRDDSAIRLLGNTVLADLMRSGEIVDIYNKWFTNPIPGQPNPVNLPLSAKLRTAFEIQGLPY